jgi:ribosomal protein S18 acetylase RimI-like enzyme
VGPVDPKGPALAAFRTAIGADWDDSGIDPEEMALFGAYDGDGLAALAACRLLAHGAADPCIVTHPARRGRGLGAAATSAACAHLLAANRLVLYQTLVSNAAAVAVARKIGFRDEATHLAVRLSG